MAMQVMRMGNYFDDFEVGMVINHCLSKTIFESDNNLFSLLTMNHHPLHTNIVYAEKSQHAKILVVGTLVFSIVVGITVPDISGKAIANLGYDTVEHLAPVYINDTIYATTKVLAKKESVSKQDRGVVRFETTGYNQRKDAVIKFQRNVLIMRTNDE
jgi:acyl dehydratase